MADACLKALSIRDPKPGDEAPWRRLWKGYVDFYEAEVSEEVTDATWRRLLDPGSGMVGRLAELEGAVVGFTVAVLHSGSWTTTQVCYLEDLFVASEARGNGIGRALIDDLIAMAKDRGWSRIYWHTRQSNDAARRLYDSYVDADDFVRYRLYLT
jgi:GNAT superfamily N-acetyltransferase